MAQAGCQAEQRPGASGHTCCTSRSVLLRRAALGPSPMKAALAEGLASAMSELRRLAGSDIAPAAGQASTSAVGTWRTRLQR